MRPNHRSRPLPPVAGRFTAEYREGARHLIVDVEGGANGLISFNAAAFEK